MPHFVVRLSAPKGFEVDRAQRQQQIVRSVRELAKAVVRICCVYINIYGIHRTNVNSIYIRVNRRYNRGAALLYIRLFILEQLVRM